MMDTAEIMRKTQRLCDLANAIVDEKDYSMEMFCKARTDKEKTQWDARLTLLQHLINTYLV